MPEYTTFYGNEELTVSDINDLIAEIRERIVVHGVPPINDFRTGAGVVFRLDSTQINVNTQATKAQTQKYSYTIGQILARNDQGVYAWREMLVVARGKTVGLTVKPKGLIGDFTNNPAYEEGRNLAVLPMTSALFYRLPGDKLNWYFKCCCGLDEYPDGYDMVSAAETAGVTKS